VPTFHPERLDEPLRWKKPARVFVCSMSDLFHEDVSDEQIAAVFGVMAAAPRHTFIVLTKRPERIRTWFNARFGLEDARETVAREAEHVAGIVFDSRGNKPFQYTNAVTPEAVANRRPFPGWPAPNVWLGVSVENQQAADERIPLLLRTPAAVRFVSMEPLIGPVDLGKWLPPGRANWQCHRCGAFPRIHGPCPYCGADKSYLCGSHVANKATPGTFTGSTNRQPLDWLIVGAESGPGARPCDPSWVSRIIAQGEAAAVPLFVKQVRAHDGKLVKMPAINGKVYAQFPNTEASK